MMIFLLTTLAFASNYSVDPTEDIGAVIGSLQPGDSLTFTAGNYSITEAWSWTLNGTSGSPIRIKGQAGATFSIASGTETAGIALTESSWVIFDGLTIQGDSSWNGGTDTYHGIYIATSEDISLRNMSISNTAGSSIRVEGDSERINIQDSRLNNTNAGAAIEIGCSDVSCWTEGGRITHNWIYNISGEKHAIHLHHGSQGFDLADNVIYAVEQGGIFLGSTENGDMNTADANAIWNSGYGILIRGAAKLNNNVIFNTSDAGVHVDDPGLGAYGEIIISFNTIANTDNWGIWADDWFSVEGNVIANNAICNPVGKSIKLVDYESEDGSESIEAHPNHFITSNLLCGLATGVYDYENHFLVGRGFIDFLNTEAWNFYPSIDSFLIDSANPSGNTYIPTHDFNSLERTGGVLEIGAYEWDGEINPGWPIQEGFKSFELTYEEPPDAYVGGCCGDADEQTKGAEEEAMLLLPLLFLGGVFRRREKWGI